MSLSIFLLWLIAPLSGDALELDAPYMLLTHKKPARLEELLNEAAAAGFHVVTTGLTTDEDMNLLLEKGTAPGPTYRVVAEADRVLFKGLVSKASEEGFRLVPTSLMTRGRIVGNKMFMAVMERRSETPSHEYKVLISAMDQNLRSVLGKLTADRWETIGMVAIKEDLHMIVMEKAR
jgi:hypothetical protein